MAEKINQLTQRVDNLEKQLRQIRKRLKPIAEKHKLTLKEKFTIHDRSQRLYSEFENWVNGMPDEVSATWMTGSTIETVNVNIRQLKQIVKALTELVDYALGVKYP